MSISGALLPLTPEQLAAVDPEKQVWLRASAGTGKTQVLTARVIRLLLSDGVEPEHLLCITFTKAGAAEMAERINGMLARWVQMDGTALFHDLEAIGAPSGPKAREKARSLFARVLDAPGGGLQILTIHSLAQSLLGSFPEEAGLIPGFNPIEGRQQSELYVEALSELVLEAEQSGDDSLISNIQALSLAMGEDGAFNFLKKCASEPIAMENVPDDAGALVYARRMAGVTFDGPVEQMLQSALSDQVIDRNAIAALAEANLAWNAKPGSRGAKRAAVIHEWLAMEVEQRTEAFDRICACWTKGTGEPLVASKGFTPLDEGYAELALSLYQWTNPLRSQIALAKYADRLAPALLAGKAFAARYGAAKKMRGLVDFDDMIRKTAVLLNQNRMADWIRYKLDSRIDHILVDEAQDTNRAQWDIISALSDDFFAGRGGKDDRHRTIFSVGDEKQAIFGFQGTDPAEYEAAREEFADKIAAAEQDLEQVSLNRSYRSNWPILRFANAVFEDIADQLGKIDSFTAHESGLPDSRSPETGRVELIAPITSDFGVADGEGEGSADEKRILAARLADRVKQLTDAAPVLSSSGKPLRPGDIMILLRRRGELASALVAQLHARGVAVAGIDRLKMQEPLVVQDMLAAVRFVLQPRDQYSLACLLVSPIIGWDQEKLLKYGYRPNGTDLWEHLRGQDEIADDLKPLRDLLSMADYTTAYAFLENLLSGDIAGRMKFAARLGDDALIPMEEMLNLALQFEQNGGGSLQAFLRWFESDETEIKREMLPGSDEVRVMTVHGSKGLQAPVVILADTTSDPEKSKSTVSFKVGGEELPLLNIRKQERFGQLEEIADRQEASDAQEHLRLLYVAITRAQEHLILAGSLSDQLKKKGKAPQASWYPHLERAMTQLGAEWRDDDHLGRVAEYAGPHFAGEAKDEMRAESGPPMLRTDLADWLTQPAPPESRPPRPLAPSRIDDDDYGEPPATANMAMAAEKGRILHGLFERIGGNDIERSLAKAEIWLSRQNLPDGLSASELLTTAAKIVRNPEYAKWFGKDARAEVPLTAIVDEMVISGRVDRLFITKSEVHVLDFKTGRTVPEDSNGITPAFMMQMASYVAALRVIFPGRTISAALLYTHNAKLIALPPEKISPDILDTSGD